MTWPTRRLSEVAELSLGKMLDQKKNRGVPRPYLANVNVRWGSFDLADLRQMRFEPRETERYGLRRDDIVMCEGGEPGRCAIWRNQVPSMMLQKALHRIRARPGLDPVFLFYCLFHSGRSGMLQQLFTGATIKHLPGEQLAKAEVPVPPLPTQRRIASILGAYDDLIENNRRRIAVLEGMARRLFQEWFIYFRFPGAREPGGAVNTTGVLPNGWTEVSLADVCDRITDGAHHSPSGVAAGRMMASVKDMRDWGFDLSDCRQISETDFAELIRMGCQPEPGDILIAKDGAKLNKHTFLVTAPLPLVLLSSIAILRPKPDMESEFLVALLKSEKTSSAIKRMRSGAAIPRIVLKDFKRLPILLPAKDARKRFEATVAPIHSLCRLLVQVSANLSAQRDTLLPRLVSGELAVAAAERELEAAD